jgi:poly-gamma-glutamate synthesis protein (capsule biosynthesis protein)
MWVSYGLGNLLSNQDSACCNPKTDSGVLLTATVTKPFGGPARGSGVEWTAVTVDRRAGHKVRILTDALADPAGGSLSVAQLQQRYDRVKAAVGDAAPERTTPPVATGDPPVVEPRSEVAGVPGAGASAPGGSPSASVVAAP